MSFSSIIGQERARDILHKALTNNRVPHAYLFNGPVGVGKEALAIEFTKALFCKSTEVRPCDACDNCRRITNFNHPDFIFIFPAMANLKTEDERAIYNSVAQNAYARIKPWANPTIGIDQIRDLRRVSNLKPLEGRRMVIIAEADKMTIPAANSLLKILEEPPPTMHLILTSSQINGMLPTILSRCQEVRFGPLSDQQIEQALVERQQIESAKAGLIAKISQGSYSRALEWLEADFTDRRAKAIEFLRVCLRDPQSQLEFVEQLMKKYDKKVIKDILSLMLMWFRDAMILQESSAHELKDSIVNQDEWQTLEKFAGAFESIDFDSAYREIEKSLQFIDRNVQVNLILIVLLIRLNLALKTRGSRS